MWPSIVAGLLLWKHDVISSWVPFFCVSAVVCIHTRRLHLKFILNRFPSTAADCQYPPESWYYLQKFLTVIYLVFIWRPDNHICLKAQGPERNLVICCLMLPSSVMHNHWCTHDYLTKSCLLNSNSSYFGHAFRYLCIYALIYNFSF